MYWAASVCLESYLVTRRVGRIVTRSRSAARARVIAPHRLLVCLWRKESGRLGSSGAVSPLRGSSEDWSLVLLSFSLSVIVWLTFIKSHQHRFLSLPITWWLVCIYQSANRADHRLNMTGKGQCRSTLKSILLDSTRRTESFPYVTFSSQIQSGIAEFFSMKRSVIVKKLTILLNTIFLVILLCLCFTCAQLISKSSL